MGKDAVSGWVEHYERAWRAQDVDDLDRLFTEHARYMRSPYAEPLDGLDAIKGFWVDPEPFDMTATVLAADGAVGVVRVDVSYPDEHHEYRNLWVITFSADGRAERFEEWAYAPDQPYTASGDA